MGIVEEQLGLVLGGHVELVWDFTECVFDESFLQLRLFTVAPRFENVDDLLASVAADLMREFLRERSNFVE